ncbi:MAG TPA: DUF5686 family protein [Bacteroidia bacterium]|nr:DUF5686 family protein [Bacteroidia bacterium]
MGIRKAILFFCLWFTAMYCHSQQCSLTGKVIDKNTGSPLPFVNMIVSGHPQIGATADIDGNFKISAPFHINSLTFSYVGYRDTIIPINNVSGNINGIVIKLEEIGFRLREVKILPGINPALRIIRAAINNKDKNNPEKVHSFMYDSYNKLYCTADMKDATDTLNSLDTIKKLRTHADSTHRRRHSVKRILKKQYLFLMESVSERKFLYPDHNYEKVLASRTSGLKDSPFDLLAQQLQSFSFYPDNITIFDNEYLNPISDGGIKRYYFIIEDTLYNGGDTVYVISFNPKSGKNFNSMKGVVYINTNGYALQNVIAQPIRDDQSMSIHIQQKYEFISPGQTIDGVKGMWFPVQLNTDWYYNNSVVNDSAIALTNNSINPDDAHNKLKIVSRSYIKDIVLDTALRKREFGRVEVEVDNNAVDRPEEFWNKYRIDTLSKKEKRTYRVIDSIGKSNHFDRKLKWFESLSTGELKMGWINLDLDKILNYNGYEKFRLGAGLHTNDEFSKVFVMGGYGAYGTGDKAFKYGGDIGLIFDPYNHVKLDFAYQHDVIGAGVVSFYNDQSLLSTESYYNYFINNMDKMQKENVSLSFDALRYFQFNLFSDEQLRTVTNSYEFGVNNDNVTVLSNHYWFTEAGLGFRFAYKENFLKSPLGMISLGTKYPIVWGNITQGFNSLLNGEYTYTKYDLKISKDFHIPQAGYSSISLLAGYVEGNVPYTLLYNGKGSYEQYTIAVDNSFETMRLNEFLSSKYVNLFYSHNFQSFLYRHKHFRPELKLVSHAGWGLLDNPGSQNGITFKTMNKGYYESGMEINNLVKSSIFRIGVGGYYRYGSYSLSTPGQNFVFKFTITTSFE